MLSPHDAIAARVLGDFLVGDKLGEGGFGTVYRAEQRGLGREAVVKTLRPSLASKGVAVERFLLEARLASRFNHPYAAHVYAFGAEPDGVLWIAMELVRGTRLDDFIASGGPLPPPRALPLLDRFCEVVQSAHDQGIVHRDIKPSNIMVLARAGRLLPKLLDFGVAKLVAATPALGDAPIATGTGDAIATAATTPSGDDTTLGSDAAGAPGLTRAGQIVGSPAYMAPEQWTGGAIGPATDQYALALVAFEILTGERAFRGRSLAQLAEEHLGAPLPPLPPELPAALHAVLARATAKRPGDRYPSVAELAVALRAAAGLDDGEASPLPPLPEALRGTWVADAPAPIASSMLALTLARNATQRLHHAGRVGAIVARWLGVLALATRSRLGRLDERDGEPARELVGALRRRRPRGEEWLDLAEALTRRAADAPETWPIPELVGFLADGSAVGALRRLCRVDAADAASPTAVADRVEDLGAAATALTWLCDYEVGRQVDGGLELWMGANGDERVTRPRRGQAGEHDGQLLLVDPDDACVVALSPLVEIAAPAPGQREELFVFGGPIDPPGDGALLASAQGFERASAAIWPWLASRVVVEDQADGAQGDEDGSPYPGLSAFRTEDRASFVGREREVLEIVNRLRVQRLIALVGASGAGKSSLLAAGVLPALPAGWRATTLRPGPSPLAALGAAIAALEGPSPDPADPAALGERLAAAARRQGTTVVVVIDQAEELCTACDRAEERDAFAGAIVRALAEPRLRVVVALRDDFLCRLDELDPWKGRLAAAVHVLGVPGRAELERIVTVPARRRGYAFDDPALPREMVDAVAGRPGALPLLAFTAARLWELRDRPFRRLARATYTRLGGVTGALVQHAEEVFARMSAVEQRLVRRGFGRLLTADGTRAPIARRELVAALGDGGAATLDHLIAARLIVTIEDVDGERVEIVHETLATAWPRLATWRRDDAEGARLRRELTVAAGRWDERGRQRDALWRGELLDELRRWRARHVEPLTPLESTFAAQSLAEARRVTRVRATAIALVVVALVAGVVGLAVANRRVVTARHAVVKNLAASLEDRGRQALLGGDAARATLYLAEARRLGIRGRSLELMLAFAAAPLEAERRSIVAHASGQVRAVVAPAGDRLLTIAADRGAAVWDLASGARLASLEHAEAPLYAGAFTGDGVVTVTQRGTVIGWDRRGAPRWRGQHGDAATTVSIAASRAGDRALSYGDDGGATLWNAATGAALARIHAPVPATAAELAPDGATVVIGRFDGSLTIHDATTLAVIGALDGHTAAIERIAFAPAGDRIVTAARDATVRVWSLATRRETARMTHRHDVTWVELSGDGRRLLTASRDGTARIWDAATGAELVRFVGHTGHVSTARWSPSGDRVVTAGLDTTARVWEAATGVPIATLQGHRSPLLDAVFADDGRSVVTTSYDGALKLWDVAAATRRRGLTGTSQHLLDARFAPDGRFALATGFDGVPVVWSMPDGAVAQTLRGHQQVVASAAFRPDGRQVATASDDGTAIVWSLDTGAALHRLAGHDGPVNVVAYAPGGERIATGGDDRTLRLWTADGAPLAVLADEHPVYRAVFAPSGRALVTSGYGRTATIWDVERRRVIAHLDHGQAAVLDVAVSPDGGAIATAADDRTVRVWSADGQLRHAMTGHQGAVMAIRYAPDGRRLVSASEDGTVRIWDPRAGTMESFLESNGSHLWSAEIDPSGERIATAATDGVVRIWEVATSRLLLALRGHVDIVTRLAFAPDGEHLLSVAQDGRAVLWDLRGDARDDAALARLVRCRIPWRLVDGLALPGAVDPAACPPARARMPP